MAGAATAQRAPLAAVVVHSKEAAVMMVGLNSESILRGVLELQSQLLGSERNFNMVSDYSKPNVSSKIVRIILSYTSYINRVVWQKQ